jgi:hypothetical protein
MLSNTAIQYGYNWHVDPAATFDCTSRNKKSYVHSSLRIQYERGNRGQAFVPIIYLQWQSSAGCGHAQTVMCMINGLKN